MPNVGHCSEVCFKDSDGKHLSCDECLTLFGPILTEEFLSSFFFIKYPLNLSCGFKVDGGSVINLLNDSDCLNNGASAAPFACPSLADILAEVGVGWVQRGFWRFDELTNGVVPLEDLRDAVEETVDHPERVMKYCVGKSRDAS